MLTDEHKRHKWEWVKNVTSTTMTPTHTRITLKGSYKCLCGAIKLGQPNFSSADLRGVV